MFVSGDFGEKKSLSKKSRGADIGPNMIYEVKAAQRNTKNYMFSLFFKQAAAQLYGTKVMDQKAFEKDYDFLRDALKRAS